MSAQGEVSGWHYASRQPICLRWEAGSLRSIEPADPTPPADRWLAPPLFDLQINGYGGIDFQQDGLTLENLLSATRQLRRAGCGRYLLTLVTDAWPKLTARLRHLRQLREQSPALQAAIAGWHIEGPFLSAAPGFCGAHDPALMLDPAPEHILELRAITGEDPLLLTLAPERPGALEVIRVAVAHGIKVSLGHTDAPVEILRQAVEAGAVGFTHLANGCPQQLDRHNNILWRVAETPGLKPSLIPDGIHVSPSLFRLLHRWWDTDTVYYVSDAMAAAGAVPGRYRLGRLQLEVGEDQVVRQPGQKLFAGSALRPVDGVFRAARMLGRPWQEAWRRFSELPARVLGLENELAGNQTEVCILTISGQQELLELKMLPP